MPTRAFTFEDLQQRFEELSGVPPRSIRIGVTDPEVARYARVLEYGSVVGQRPWPHPGARTVLAIDPETGAQVVVSAQAPQGFIRVQARAFADLLRQHLARSTDWLEAAQVSSLARDAVRDAGAAALERLRAAAPERSGRLRENLEILAE
jgi:hypothetical protein